MGLRHGNCSKRPICQSMIAMLDDVMPLHYRHERHRWGAVHRCGSSLERGTPLSGGRSDFLSPMRALRIRKTLQAIFGWYRYREWELGMADGKIPRYLA